MQTWHPEELAKIAEADDLHVSPFRKDGATYGTPTWIWSVVVNGELFARAYNGRSSSWHRAAVVQRAGRIQSSGLIYEVTFEPVEDVVQNEIDGAYRKKYSDSPYLEAMLSSRALGATIRIVPRSVKEES